MEQTINLRNFPILWSFWIYNLSSLNPAVRDCHLKFLLQNQSVGEALLNFFFVWFQACQGWDVAPSLPAPGAVALNQQNTPSAASALPAPAPSCCLGRTARGMKQPLTGCREQPVSPRFLPQSTNRGCLCLWTRLAGYRGALPPPCVFYHPQTELAPAPEAQPNPAGRCGKTWLLLQGSNSAGATMSHREENLIRLTLPSA